MKIFFFFVLRIMGLFSLRNQSTRIFFNGRSHYSNVHRNRASMPLIYHKISTLGILLLMEYCNFFQISYMEDISIPGCRSYRSVDIFLLYHQISGDFVSFCSQNLFSPSNPERNQSRWKKTKTQSRSIVEWWWQKEKEKSQDQRKNGWFLWMHLKFYSIWVSEGYSR